MTKATKPRVNAGAAPQVTWLPVKSIVLNPSNPRIIRDARFKKLVESLKNFPKMLEIRPIVVDEDTMILGGEKRLKAAKELGWKDVPTVRMTGLTKDEKDEFTIRDNINFGEWDWNILRTEWDLPIVEAWGLAMPAEDKAVSFKASSLTLRVKCKSAEEKAALATKLIQEGYDVTMPKA